jgi:nucleoid DNA-binding protein
MGELVNLVAQRTGLSQEDARKAVEAVIDIKKQTSCANSESA